MNERGSGARARLRAGLTALLGVVALAGTVACAPAEDAAESDAADADTVQPAEGPAAGVDRDAEAESIRDIGRRWLAAVAAKDTAFIRNAYAEDARFMAPGAEAATGSEAIVGAWGQLFALPNVSLTFAPSALEVAAAGDMAYEVGTYQLTFDGEEGEVEDRGSYVVVWEKRNGEWKAVADIVTSELAS
ncbi:MAG: DUF4440 domain-containing protein [Gemmatimonadota bacterium]